MNSGRYTEALRFEHYPTLAASLLLNRAQAYILLGNYTLAVKDAQKYLSEIATNPDHAKAQDEKALSEVQRLRTHYEITRMLRFSSKDW